MDSNPPKFEHGNYDNFDELHDAGYLPSGETDSDGKTPLTRRHASEPVLLSLADLEAMNLEAERKKTQASKLNAKKSTAEKDLLQSWGCAPAGRSKASKTSNSSQARKVAPTQSPAGTTVGSRNGSMISLGGAETLSGESSTLSNRNVRLVVAGSPAMDAITDAASDASHKTSTLASKLSSLRASVEIPDKTPLPAVAAEACDFYIAYDAATDEDAAVLLTEAVEEGVVRWDETSADCFLDIHSIDHLQISKGKWRKRAMSERLARLQGAKVIVVVLSEKSIRRLRKGHVQASQLLWEIEQAIAGTRTVVPVFVGQGGKACRKIHPEEFADSPVYSVWGEGNVQDIMRELLSRSALQAPSRLTDSAEVAALVSQLGTVFKGDLLSDGTKMLTDDEDVVSTDDEDIAEADEANSGATMVAQPSYRAKSVASVTPDETEDEDMESFDWEHWQLDRSRVDVFDKIGEGEFGEVCSGELHGSGKNEGMKAKTAVKKQTKGSKNLFLKEAHTMLTLHHTNIVNIYGVCTLEPPILIVSELCEHGSVKSFLKSWHAREVTWKHEEKMIFEICNGMAYIAEEGFIHRDLAARNVLVEDPLKCKVADFGMAVQLPDGKDYFQGDRNQPVPIRWSSPEAILHGRFSSKSDVWAFGIVIYEIVTFCKEPYEGASNKDVVTKVCREGVRLPCPTKQRAPRGCPEEVHNIMLKCWQHDPEDRPTFAELLDVHLPAAGILPP
eukprot:m.545336 g.545336  ORF g.545336 m.545336 type:complete len:729 (+) comp22145_c0_seq2:142-2328(+)